MATKLKYIDHIGIVVTDLSSAKAVFIDLDFTVQDEAEERSDLLDKVVGVKNACSQIVFLATSDSQTKLELTNLSSARGIISSRLASISRS